MTLMRSPVHYDPQKAAGQDSGYALPYDWGEEMASGRPKVFFWIVDNWYEVPTAWRRFWMPFTEPLPYEEALALYTLWVEAAKKDNDQLVVLFSDQGCIRGGDDQPWLGLVQLAAFRGEVLDFIEQDKDEDMGWLARTYRWMAEPKTKFTDPPWPHP